MVPGYQIRQDPRCNFSISTHCFSEILLSPHGSSSRVSFISTPYPVFNMSIHIIGLTDIFLKARSIFTKIVPKPSQARPILCFE